MPTLSSKQDKKKPAKPENYCFLEDPHFHAQLEGIPVQISLIEFDFLFSEDGSEVDTKKSDISEAITKSVCFSDKQPSVRKYSDISKQRSSVEWAKAFSNIKEGTEPKSPSIKTSSKHLPLKETGKKTLVSKASAKPTTLIEYAFSDMRYPSQCYDLISRNDLKTVERRVSMLEKEMEIIKQSVSTEKALEPGIKKFYKEMSNTSSALDRSPTRKFSSDKPQLIMADHTPNKKKKETTNTCYESSEHYKTMEFSLDSDSFMMYSRQSENIIEIMHSKVMEDKSKSSELGDEADRLERSIRKRRFQKESRNKLFWWTSTRSRETIQRDLKPTRLSPSSISQKRKGDLLNGVKEFEIAKNTEDFSVLSKVSRLSKSETRGKVKYEKEVSGRRASGWRDLLHCLYTTNSAYKPSTESLRSASDPGPVSQNKELEPLKERKQLKKKKRKS